MQENSAAFTSALLRTLRPIVRLLLRRGVSLKSFSELLKWLYVDVAAEPLGPDGRHRAVSRISAMTGLTRREVARLIIMPENRDCELDARFNRASRVIAGWLRDPAFAAARGIPAILNIGGDGATFNEVVRRYSGDMTPRAMLDQLLRIGAVKILTNGRLKLLVRSYIPAAGSDERTCILGTDVGHFISTIDHNLTSKNPQATRFQRKVCYDKLPPEVLSEFRRIAVGFSQKLLEELDQWLAQRDPDSDFGEAPSEGHVAGFGDYYFEEPYRMQHGDPSVGDDRKGPDKRG